MLRSGSTSTVEERDTVFARDIAVMTAATHPKKKRIQHPTRSNSDTDNQRKRDDNDSDGDSDSKGHPARGHTSTFIGRRTQQGRALEAALPDVRTVRSCSLGSARGVDGNMATHRSMD